jgi:hypothetical protein
MFNGTESEQQVAFLCIESGQLAAQIGGLSDDFLDDFHPRNSLTDRQRKLT